MDEIGQQHRQRARCLYFRITVGADQAQAPLRGPVRQRRQQVEGITPSPLQVVSVNGAGAP